MLKKMLQSLARRRGKKTAIRPIGWRGFRPTMQLLDNRVLPAVTAVFQPGSGLLSVFGDNLANEITITRDAAGALHVQSGSLAVAKGSNVNAAAAGNVTIVGGTPTVANTSLIQVFGQGGSDAIRLDESNGALPRGNLFGGAGDDTLTGGSGGDMLFGQAGNDSISGKGGIDFLFGGADADTLTGGDADDQVFGESGDDRMVWNPGDDTDLNEGGTGVDSIIVNGGNGSEQFTVTANDTRVRFDRLNPAPFAIDIGTSEKLVVNMNGGDDSFSATGNLAALIQITVDGGTGNDTILGSNGADLLLGGDGADFIDGQQGIDLALMGPGNDVFQWDPGDGNDVVEGQAGEDTLRFNGANIGEIFDISANGKRVRFTRNIANIVMDLGEIETINVNALGGADTLTVNDLSGLGVTAVNVDLGSTIGGTTGDAQADIIIVNGTSGKDIVDVFGSGTSVAVVGLPTQVNVTNSEGANDSLVINTLAGSDGITASTLVAGITKLTLDGGADGDTILGSRGADTLIGGSGSDFIDGQQGDDLALLGADADTFEWQPGDGSDTVEGQGGTDLLLFFGANVSENIDISANGPHVRFFRDVANVTMDLDDVERIEFRALGGADNIVVGDMSGTDLANLELDLRGPNGTPDGQGDSVTVNGTQGDDTIGVAGDAGGVSVFGLATKVNIFHQEATLDRLTVNAQGGNDTVDATSLEADGIALTINGGLGADLLRGSEGDDLVNGGDGNDTALLGAGNDTFVWNPGDDNDTIEGQAGQDELLFNGANISEIIDITANGSRLRLTRNIANIVMDTNGLEVVTVNALGGADSISIGDLSGTDASDIRLNLSGSGGTGDAQADTVVVNGTAQDDIIVVTGNASGVSVIGLPAAVHVTGSEVANDRLVINALAGDDVIEASGLAAGAIMLVADGGTGDDVIVGSDGADVLMGGEDDDVLVGGPSVDILDGGFGDNIVIQ